jgi:hypothetical protein
MQQVSAGIGLYFRTLWYFLVLMLLASLLAIYPIIDNTQADRTTTTYPLRNGAGNVVNGSCDKAYDVRCSAGRSCCNSVQALQLEDLFGSEARRR